MKYLSINIFYKLVPFIKILFICAARSYNRPSQKEKEKKNYFCSLANFNKSVLTIQPTHQPMAQCGHLHFCFQAVLEQVLGSNLEQTFEPIQTSGHCRSSVLGRAVQLLTVLTSAAALVAASVTMLVCKSAAVAPLVLTSV